MISEWSNISQHFNYRKFSVDSLQLLFLNQIGVTSIGNLPISKTYRSELDGGIQCSVAGPDMFHPRVPLYPIHSTPSRLNITFNSVKLGYDEVQFCKTYFATMNIKRQLKNINQRVWLEVPQVVKDWNIYAAYSTCSNNMTSFLL